MATEEMNLPPTTPSPATKMSLDELADALEKTTSLEEFLTLGLESGQVVELILETPDGKSKVIWRREAAEPKPPEPDK